MRYIGLSVPIQSKALGNVRKTISTIVLKACMAITSKLLILYLYI